MTDPRFSNPLLGLNYVSNYSRCRRVASSDRVQEMQQHPPARKQMMRRRTSMGDALDSSYSESEGLPDQVGNPDD